MELAYIKTIDSDEDMIIGDLVGQSAGYVMLKNPLLYNEEGVEQMDAPYLDLNSIEPSVVTFLSHTILRWGKITDKFWREVYDEQIERFKERRLKSDEVV